MLGMFMMNSNFSRELRFVRMVVRFYLKPRNDEISFWMEFILVLNNTLYLFNKWIVFKDL